MIVRKWLYALLVAVLCLAVVSPMLQSQQAAPQLSTAVQVNAPGQAQTSQQFWSQTATGAASAANCTQPAQAGKINYCTGFEVTGSGATAASVISVTIQDGGTTVANYALTIPAGTTTAVNNLIVEFPQPIVGLGPGRNMVLNVPSFGAGNTNSAATFHGYTQ